MPLGTEVRLRLRDIVLDGDPAPSPKRGTTPNFRPMSVVARRLVGLRCHWYGGRPRLMRLCVPCGPSYPQKKGHAHPQFATQIRPMSIVAKRWVDQDATCYGGKRQATLC